jgi:hypothetical protein
MPSGYSHGLVLAVALGMVLGGVIKVVTASIASAAKINVPGLS